MEQGPSAISSASAMALSNQTIDPRKSNVNQAKSESRREESIIDVVETSDRDPRERLEYEADRSASGENSRPEVSACEETCEGESSNTEGCQASVAGEDVHHPEQRCQGEMTPPGGRLDIQA